MRIGINTRSLLGQKMEGFGNYTLELVNRLTTAHPEHTFICYFDGPVDPRFSFGPNVICKSIFPPTGHPFLYVIWFQWRLKRAIHKDHLDVFLSPDGMFPLGIHIPVLATIHALNFEHFPQDLPKWVAWYYKKYFPKFAKAANKIITVSQTTKEDIRATYQIEQGQSGLSTLEFRRENNLYAGRRFSRKLFFIRRVLAPKKEHPPLA